MREPFAVSFGEQEGLSNFELLVLSRTYLRRNMYLQEKGHNMSLFALFKAFYEAIQGLLALSGKK